MTAAYTVTATEGDMMTGTTEVMTETGMTTGTAEDVTGAGMTTGIAEAMTNTVKGATDCRPITDLLDTVKTTYSTGGLMIQTLRTRSVLICIVAVLSMSWLAGCAHHERAPENRPGYLYYHKPLPEASRALDAARTAGKDRECPDEFKSASDLVDKAYETYMACYTQEAIGMAQDAISRIRALCPAKPVIAAKPEPRPEPVSPPAAPKAEPIPPPPAPVAAAVKILLEDVHFDFDKATLTKVAVGILDSDTKTLKENPDVKVQIEGHTCAHGAADYNMALAERRAQAVKEYLVQKGIAADRMTTITYGETRLALPETPTPHNKNSKEAQTNRRVHFEVIVK